MTSVTLGALHRLSKQTVIALIIVVLLTACGGDDEADATATVATTPAAGGMVVPTAAGDAAQAATAAPAPTPVPALLIGDTVQVLPDQEVRLYTDATAGSLVMGVYAAGERFTVLDPSGDYAIYPVENEGRLWYRLRAPDGLVGWGTADQIGAAE